MMQTRSRPPIQPPILLLAALLLLTGGCSLFPEGRPLKVLDLDPPVPAGPPEPAAWSLDIELPASDPLRARERVLVRTGDRQLQAHPGARWVAPPPELLRMLTIRRLRDANVLGEVGASLIGADRQLRVDIRAFELVDNGSSLAAVIQLEARLYRRRGPELLARRLFSEREAMDSIDPAEIVVAFDALLGNYIAGLSNWLLQQPDPATAGPDPVR